MNLEMSTTFYKSWIGLKSGECSGHALHRVSEECPSKDMSAILKHPDFIVAYTVREWNGEDIVQSNAHQTPTRKSGPNPCYVNTPSTVM